MRNVFASSMQNGRLGVMVAAEGRTEVDASGNRFVILENGRRYEGTPGTPSYRVMEFERYQIRMESKEASSGPRQPKQPKRHDTGLPCIPNALFLPVWPARAASMPP
mgnify:CR=1 FL=1